MLFKWSGRTKCQKKSWDLEAIGNVQKEQKCHGREVGRRPKGVDLDRCSSLNAHLSCLTWQVPE